MTTVRITIDDNLPFSKLKEMLSALPGVKAIEVIKDVKNRKKYKQQEEEEKELFLTNSKRAMLTQIEKYL